MKISLIITCLIIGTLASHAALPKPKNPSVQVLSRRMDCFYFKVNKDVIGAALEVFSDNGAKVLEGKIVHKRMLVDFYYLDKGTYTIRIRQGDQVHSFDYQKKTRSQHIPVDMIDIITAR